MKMPTLNTKFIKDNMLSIFLGLIVVYCMMNKKSPVDAVKEGFAQLAAGGSAGPVEEAGPGPSAKASGPSGVKSVVKPNDEEEMEYGAVGAKQEIDLPSCAQFVSSNLLPKDDPKLDANFSEFSPAKDLEGQSFIDTNKYAIGMQSQTLRNANHQLRSDPPISNTMECASPWNNTTIAAEARRPLTIGSTA